MAEAARRYHHGDLETALIQAGLDLLEQRNDKGLSLREIARAVGVSATSVYRHFPDKGALLSALGQTGLRRLAKAQRQAAMAVGDGIEGFYATGRAYIDFAVAHPALFRLIFADFPQAADRDWTQKTDDAMRFLLENVQRVVDPALGELAVRTYALRAWGLVHGIAMLILDKQVFLDDAALDAVVRMPPPGRAENAAVVKAVTRATPAAKAV